MLRYRLLHAAARIVRRAGQVVLRLPAHWPWAVELAEAYARGRSPRHLRAGPGVTPA
jgi:hypothetical protein